MYGQGNAERNYYTPSESPEGELEQTRAVYCQNEDCRDFELEVEETLIVGYSGTYGSASYNCPTCGLQSDHEFTLDEYDFGYDPDAREGK